MKYFKTKQVIYWNCEDCKRILTRNEKMYSSGICPWCNVYSGCSIVDCYPVIRVFGYKTLWHWLFCKSIFIKDITITKRPTE